MGSSHLFNTGMRVAFIFIIFCIFAISIAMNLDAKGEDLLGCKGEGDCCGYDLLRHCCNGMKCVSDGSDNCMCTCHHRNVEDEAEDEKLCHDDPGNLLRGLF